MPSRSMGSPGSDGSEVFLEAVPARIIALLRERTGVDFTDYKPSLLTRCIHRRMALSGVQRSGDYVRRLEDETGEVEFLRREILVGVTSFFRNMEPFAALADRWLPELLRRKARSRLRFWVAGCSTGEEAYSLAILGREAADRLDANIDVEVLATDADGDALRLAEEGVYATRIGSDPPRGLSDKYFIRKHGSFQIVPSIRRMVRFIRHVLPENPPFRDIDFISCRNLLIYLQPGLQRRILELFYATLNHPGMLFLGSCESTGELAERFEALGYGSKIYRSRG